MKSRNHNIYHTNQAYLERLAQEYKDTGRYVQLEPGHLIVFARPPAKPDKKKNDPKNRGRKKY